MKKVSFVLAALATIAVAFQALQARKRLAFVSVATEIFTATVANSVSTARTVVLVLNTACVKIVVGIAVGTATATRIGW